MGAIGVQAAPTTTACSLWKPRAPPRPVALPATFTLAKPLGAQVLVKRVALPTLAAGVTATALPSARAASAEQSRRSDSAA
jgi:hypothetical protein